MIGSNLAGVVKMEEVVGKNGDSCRGVGGSMGPQRLVVLVRARIAALGKQPEDVAHDDDCDGDRWPKQDATASPRSRQSSFPGQPTSAGSLRALLVPPKPRSVPDGSSLYEEEGPKKENFRCFLCNLSMKTVK